MIKGKGLERGPFKYMKSLLLVGLPRSFTTFSYKIACECTPQLYATSTNAGEILNYLPPQSKHVEQREHYCQDNKSIEEYTQYLLLFKNGYVIKDVVQPFVIQNLLKKHPRTFNIIHINRMIQDSTYAMIKRNWWYPLRLTNMDLLNEAEFRQENDNPPDEYIVGMLNGLSTAYSVYSKLPKASFADLTSAEETLPNLIKQYGYTTKKYSYIDNNFNNILKEKLLYRETELWTKIDYLYKKVITSG